MDRLPNQDQISQPETESTLEAFLKESRYGNTSNQHAKKKKRLDVAPGKSISALEGNQNDDRADNNSPSILDPEEPGPSTSHETEASTITSDLTNAMDNNTNLTRTTRKKRQDDDEDSEDDNLVEHGDEESECTVGQFVLVKFFTSRGKKSYKYVCQILDLDPLLVEGFKSVGNKKIYKRIKGDISEIDNIDIVSFLPKPVEKKDIVEFPYDINTL